MFLCISQKISKGEKVFPFLLPWNRPVPHIINTILFKRIKNILPALPFSCILSWQTTGPTLRPAVSCSHFVHTAFVLEAFNTAENWDNTLHSSNIVSAVELDLQIIIPLVVHYEEYLFYNSNCVFIGSCSQITDLIEQPNPVLAVQVIITASRDS